MNPVPKGCKHHNIDGFWCPNCLEELWTEKEKYKAFIVGLLDRTPWQIGAEATDLLNTGVLNERSNVSVCSAVESSPSPQYGKAIEEVSLSPEKRAEYDIYFKHLEGYPFDQQVKGLRDAVLRAATSAAKFRGFVQAVLQWPELASRKLSVEEARQFKLCRICKKPESVPFTLDFGKEYAHTYCLIDTKKVLAKVLARVPEGHRGGVGVNIPDNLLGVERIKLNLFDDRGRTIARHEYTISELFNEDSKQHD